MSSTRAQTGSVDFERAEHFRPWVERWQRRQDELEVVRKGFPRLNEGKVTRIVAWVGRSTASRSPGQVQLGQDVR